MTERGKIRLSAGGSGLRPGLVDLYGEFEGDFPGRHGGAPDRELYIYNLPPLVYLFFIVLAYIPP